MNNITWNDADEENAWHEVYVDFAQRLLADMGPNTTPAKIWVLAAEHADAALVEWRKRIAPTTLDEGEVPQ